MSRALRNPEPDTLRATLVGSSAVFLWATLALLTTLSGPIPPFQLTAMSFAVAFGIGLVLWQRRGGAVWSHLRLPPAVWLLGVGGLFGYHFFYFVALQNAPAVEASPIAYLWPLSQPGCVLVRCAAPLDPSAGAFWIGPVHVARGCGLHPHHWWRGAGRAGNVTTLVQ